MLKQSKTFSKNHLVGAGQGGVNDEIFCMKELSIKI